MADDRTYIRVHDGLDENAKIAGLSDGAFRLLIESWCYCSRNLTDGRIAAAIWKKRGTPRARRELIDASLVKQHDGHVEMHDYLEHQRSAEEIRLLREVRGDTGSYGNHVRWHVVKRKPKKGCEHCYPPGEEDPGFIANAIANGIATAIANPSQTDRKPIASTEAEAEAEAEVLLSTDKGGSHVSNARATPPPLYSDRCIRHSNVLEPGNCGACKDVRKANEARPTLTVVPANYCLVHDVSFDRICNGCEADRKAAPEEESA